MKIRPEWAVLTVLVSALIVTVSTNIGTVPFSYLPGVQTGWEQRAEDMGIDVVFTDDHRNCGAALGDGTGGGCFDPSTPDRIYIGTGLNAAQLEKTALHELAHAWQHSVGAALNECMADRLAAEWGATGPFHYCN